MGNLTRMAQAPAAERAVLLQSQGNIYEAFRQAIEAGEFRLLYQPILNLRSNNLVGAEALLRWQRGDTLLCAEHFIEALEKSDLFDTVEEWVLREACKRAAWIQEKLTSSFRIAVNVAPQQWTRGGLRRAVVGALDESGCDPEMLDIEITERTALCDCPSVQNTMRDFRDMGITVTLDDFGAGHANFTCLRQFPINHMKIDKFYCQHAKARDRVLAGIISMTHRSGITCTAEGIETQAQLHALQMSACDEAQGFFIGRPMEFGSLVEGLRHELARGARLERQAS
jgi:EAL domain-containing protein (putative c-di-GMP-specific phosphodiesterase class I)